MTNPKVSVIMPAYNVGPYIDEAARSVLAQRGVAFELLIGDDGSPDETWECIQPYRADPRVRAWRFRRHRGEAATRNALLRFARGKYVSICDADDLLLPGNLARLAAVLDRHPRIGVTYGRLAVMDAQGRRIRKRFDFPGPSQRWDLLCNVVPHPGTMIRRSLLRTVGGYRVRCRVMPDYDLFLRLAEVTQIHPLPQRTLCAYRWHARSDFRTAKHALIRCTRRRVLAEAIARRYGVQVPWSGVRRKAAGSGPLAGRR